MRFGRFGETAMWILVALRQGPLRPARLLDEVRALDGLVGPGSLFGAVARLEAIGLIECVQSDDGLAAYGLSGQALNHRLANGKGASQ